MTTATESRYRGSFKVDGVERYYNIPAESVEDVDTKLVNMHPGRTVEVVSVGLVE